MRMVLNIAKYNFRMFVHRVAIYDIKLQFTEICVALKASNISVGAYLFSYCNLFFCDRYFRLEIFAFEV